MHLVAGQIDLGRQVVDLSVDANPRETLRCEIGQQLFVGALPAAHDGSEHLEPGAFGHPQDAIDDLLRGLTYEAFAGLGIMGNSHPGEEQPEVVVDLGDRSHGGARVARGRLLVDRYRRGESLDDIHVRLVHLAEELPCVRGERLHVAALALGVDRVERERGLAGSRQAGEHDQAIARKVEIDVVEVVLAGSPDDDLVVTGSRRS